MRSDDDRSRILNKLLPMSSDYSVTYVSGRAELSNRQSLASHLAAVVSGRLEMWRAIHPNTASCQYRLLGALSTQ
jgi:hypothetical protein